MPKSAVRARQVAPRDLALSALIAAAMASMGCVSRTEYGECVGLFDDRDPSLRYETSVRNVVIGAVLIETLIVPAFVVATQWHCPVGTKP
jgi:hypothetical protein